MREGTCDCAIVVYRYERLLCSSVAEQMYNYPLTTTTSAATELGRGCRDEGGDDGWA